MAGVIWIFQNTGPIYSKTSNMSGATTSRYFLGVDGGQSSTTALIGDDAGRVIGMGRGGPCNHVGAAEGRYKFISAIGECIGEASGQAGLNSPTVRFRSACLGFSGGPADKEAILREILSADQMTVTHDGAIALSGATGGKPGIIVIAGTGSFAFGRNAADQTARAGGWGYVFGDEGGGFDLARQALRASLRMEEGWGPPTILRQKLLHETGAADANDLLHSFYTADFTRPRIAALSKLVDEAAVAGDEVARDLLNRAADDLERLVAAVEHQLFRTDEPVEVAYVGGVFGSATLLGRFLQLVKDAHPPLYGPAAGALIEARRAAGFDPKLTGIPATEK